MRRSSHLIDVIIDGRSLKTQGKDVILQVDGRSVYRSTAPRSELRSNQIDDLKISVLKSFLEAADSSFGHIDRFRIVRSLSESPKAFSEIKRLFSLTSATADYHLKRLVDSLIIYKDESGRYALTLLGELILDYFSRFINEAENLQKALIS
jgi:DNA-binding transcriptional ArsR family regulator